MYHRYQPMGNGRFQRQTVPSPPPRAQTPPEQPRQERPPAPPPQSPPPQQAPPRQAPPPPQSAPPPQRSAPPPAEAPNFHLPFLEKLLPGMDNGDILLLLILLLLISEGNEDATSVIMTLAIFLFLQ